MSRAPLPGLRTAPALTAPVLLLAAALLVLGAGPAAAHGGGDVVDGSNYASRIGGVVDAATGTAVDDGELRWRVLANDALLELRNGGDAEVVVSGYEGEPYLRIGPDGVFENVASPASVLNDDRFGLGAIPAGVSASEEPSWQRISAAPVWRWHDHRIHWMATTAPPQVKIDPKAEVEILAWQVPYASQGQQFAVTGTLWWVPRPAPWPWLAAAALGLAVPLALAARSALGQGDGQSELDRRRGAVVRAAAGLTAAVGLLTVARAVDDALAFPAPAGADAVLLARAGLLALPALAAVSWARRAGNRAAVAVAAGAALLALGNASDAIALLSTSQVASAAPAAARLVSALVLALVVPTAVSLAVALTSRRAPARPRTAPRPGRPPTPDAPASLAAPASAPGEPASAATGSGETGQAPGTLVPRPRQ